MRVSMTNLQKSELREADVIASLVEFNTPRFFNILLKGHGSLKLSHQK